MSNITPLLKNSPLPYTAKKKGPAKHLVILNFLLPVDASPVGYNAVVGELSPIRRE